MDGFKKRGLGVAAISYDSPEVLADFATRRKISFPLLSDPGSKIIRAFGILNDTDYPQGAFGHGVPYPGTFVTDARGVVRSKFFEKAYVQRRTAASLLASLGAPLGDGAMEIRTPQFVLRTSASNRTVAPGHLVSLVLDFEMGDHMHAYAPGGHTYRPLTLTLDPHPLVTQGTLSLPKSVSYTFAPLKETVPVFEGSFRVIQDVSLAGPTKEMMEALKAPSPEIAITGTLSYQVCSNEVCFAPSKIPVMWKLSLIPLDRERAPEALRRE